jgi:selenide,water dikinase
LAQVLRPLASALDSPELAQSPIAQNLLVGLGAPDDAAVYRMSGDRAIIETMDFFPPVVDDAYAFGAIAAANAMSDVYAMGGEVLFGLNIVAWREDLPLELLSEILRGGAEKMREGDGVIAGGHTITDQEPKYGIAVTGIVDPRDLMTKGGAQAGDLLVLTKPLGTGILTTAGKRGIASDADLSNAIRWMMTLNRSACLAARSAGIRTATDITGYGLLGHAYEMASAAAVQFEFDLQALPVLDGALALANQDSLPGGTARNRDYLRDKVFLPEGLSDEWDALLFDPQTSGGLLFAVSPERREPLERALQQQQIMYWVVGRVTPGSGVRVF